MADQVAEFEQGTRYVWQNETIRLGPIWMEVVKPTGRLKPRHVYFRCIGPTGEPYAKLRAQPLPLPVNMRRQNWTDEDVRRTAEELRSGRDADDGTSVGAGTAPTGGVAVTTAD